MKFPVSVLDRQKYFEEIFKLLEDDECQIYIDTNIIALMYRIYDSARKEFFDWVTILIQKNRVHTPLWALNEYTNRFINGQIEDYLSPLKKVNAINRDFEDVSNFLKMNIDHSSLNGTKYADLKEFENDLKLISEKLKSIAVTAKSKDEKYKLKIHDEIKNHFEKTILNSSIDDILSKINHHGLVRYNHKFPPGFQDSQKDLNAYGDLIIWHEILEHCKSSKINKAILITNDVKKDWVYAPNKIIENGKPIPNVGQLKIADTRLIYEFKLATNSEEFYIINFDLLTQILIQNIKGNFLELAKALQIAHKQDTPEENISVSENLENSSEQESITIDQQVYSQSIDPEATLEYSNHALTDSEFPLYDETFSSEIISNLKTYNWYVQNPTLVKFLESDLNTIEQTHISADKLFVIGRNIYQAACGASSVAVDFMNNINFHFNKFNDFVSEHLFSGILYEIYFNSYNEFRSELKSDFITQVLSIKENQNLKRSLNFIDKKLDPFKSFLLYIPSDDNIVKLKVELDEEITSSEDWLGEITHFKDIEVLEANGKSLLTTDTAISLNMYYQIYNIDAFITLISSSYGIPKNKIEIIDKEILNEECLIEFQNKRLKKLYYPGIF